MTGNRIARMLSHARVPHRARQTRIAVPLSLALLGIIAAIVMQGGGGSGAPGSFGPGVTTRPQGIRPPAPTSGTRPGQPLATPPAPSGATTSPQTRPAAFAFRTNLLRGLHGTFDGGTGGWVAEAPATLSSVRSPVAGGSGSLAVTNAGTASSMLLALSGSGPGTWTPAMPGTRWLGHVSTRAARSAAYAAVIVRFLDAGGQRLAQSGAQRTVNKTTTFQQTWDAVGIAPPGTAYVVLMVTFQTVPAGAAHYIDNASLMALPGGSPPIAGPLRTAGNRILDARGRPVTLRGFTRSGLEGVDAPPPTDDDIAHAKLWGANFIRIPLGEQFWLRSSCYYRSDYQAQVDAVVRSVTGRGMLALLDLHWNTIKPCGPYSQQPMADAPNAVAFWQQVAGRYQTNPLVAFDLYNEPHNITDAQWRDGGTVRWKGGSFEAAGMQQLYDAVRGTGATNLVFASGKAWANSWPSTAPLTGHDIVYAVHAYTCPTTPPPHCDNSAPYDPGQYLRSWNAVGRAYPVVVTEFGWPNPNDAAFNRNVISYAEQHGWGWAAYTWGDVIWGPFSLLADAGPGRSYQPRPTGSVVLAAFPGA